MTSGEEPSAPPALEAVAKETSRRAREVVKKRRPKRKASKRKPAKKAARKKARRVRDPRLKKKARRPAEPKYALTELETMAASLEEMARNLRGAVEVVRAVEAQRVQEEERVMAMARAPE